MACLYYMPVYLSPRAITAGFPNHELFPFGVAAGDVRGPISDDSASSPVTLAVPFTFVGTEYSQIFVRIMCLCTVLCSNDPDMMLGTWYILAVAMNCVAVQIAIYVCACGFNFDLNIPYGN